MCGKAKKNWTLDDPNGVPSDEPSASPTPQPTDSPVIVAQRANGVYYQHAMPVALPLSNGYPWYQKGVGEVATPNYAEIRFIDASWHMLDVAQGIQFEERDGSTCGSARTCCS